MSFYGTPLTAEDADPEKKSSLSMAMPPHEQQGTSHGDAEAIDVADVGADKKTPLSWLTRHSGLVRCVKLCALAVLILAWWISSTVLPATRHRWIVQTFFAWSFISIIAFRFIPSSVVARPVEAVWIPLVQRPFFVLSRRARYALGWLAVVAIVMGSAFGFKIENVGLS